jgi:hypothetical protein
LYIFMTTPRRVFKQKSELLSNNKIVGQTRHNPVFFPLLSRKKHW